MMVRKVQESIRITIKIRSIHSINNYRLIYRDYDELESNFKPNVHSKIQVRRYTASTFISLVKEDTSIGFIKDRRNRIEEIDGLKRCINKLLNRKIKKDDPLKIEKEKAIILDIYNKFKVLLIKTYESDERIEAKLIFKLLNHIRFSQFKDKPYLLYYIVKEMIECSMKSFDIDEIQLSKWTQITMNKLNLIHEPNLCLTLLKIYKLKYPKASLSIFILESEIQAYLLSNQPFIALNRFNELTQPRLYTFNLLLTYTKNFKLKLGFNNLLFKLNQSKYTKDGYTKLLILANLLASGKAPISNLVKQYYLRYLNQSHSKTKRFLTTLIFQHLHNLNYHQFSPLLKELPFSYLKDPKFEMALLQSLIKSQDWSTLKSILEKMENHTILSNSKLLYIMLPYFATIYSPNKLIACLDNPKFDLSDKLFLAWRYLKLTRHWIPTTTLLDHIHQLPYPHSRYHNIYLANIHVVFQTVLTRIEPHQIGSIVKKGPDHLKQATYYAAIMFEFLAERNLPLDLYSRVIIASAYRFLGSYELAIDLLTPCLNLGQVQDISIQSKISSKSLFQPLNLANFKADPILYALYYHLTNLQRTSMSSQSTAPLNIPSALVSLDLLLHELYAWHRSTVDVQLKHQRILRLLRRLDRWGDSERVAYRARVLYNDKTFLQYYF